MTTNRISVLLADDHTVVREGLRLLLASESDIEVVGEAANGREAVLLAQQLQPAVLLMDILMPRLNGVEATRQVRQLCPDTRILILTSRSEDRYIQQTTALGVAGYLLKDTTASALRTAIRNVHQGKKAFSPSIACRLPNQCADHCGKCDYQHACLSAREVEVLQLVAEGLPNKQIAPELGISVRTAEKHRGSLTHKLKIYDTAGLTRYAIGAGLIDAAGKPAA
ncbi:MAG: response regulator transcription factor [Kiritimatiellaeota bacterium]|nr:response regulator transcription factor [Kiritimatiellota bacterium]